VGEQSNAYRILLRYDRKSRHRRIKKQRRYERLAATSQFRCTDHLHSSGWPSHFSALCGPVDGCTLSGGRSPYLRRHMAPTPWRALNRPALIQGAGSAADCLYSLTCYRPAPRAGSAWRCYHPSLGTKDLTRVSRIQECCPSLSHHLCGGGQTSLS
jgi:hypothetical protein